MSIRKTNEWLIGNASPVGMVGISGALGIWIGSRVALDFQRIFDSQPGSCWAFLIFGALLGRMSRNNSNWLGLARYEMDCARTLDALASAYHRESCRFSAKLGMKMLVSSIMIAFAFSSHLYIGLISSCIVIFLAFTSVKKWRTDVNAMADAYADHLTSD